MRAQRLPKLDSPSWVILPILVLGLGGSAGCGPASSSHVSPHTKRHHHHHCHEQPTARCHTHRHGPGHH